MSPSAPAFRLQPFGTSIPGTNSLLAELITRGQAMEELSDITNPYFPEVARGVLDEAADAGYNVLVANPDSLVDRLRHHVNAPRGQCVDGMIFTAIVSTRVATSCSR